jgi:hypothetical protein
MATLSQSLAGLVDVIVQKGMMTPREITRAHALLEELARVEGVASMQPQPLEAALLVDVSFKPGHYPSERRAKELFRLYLQLRAVYRASLPFGGLGVPRVKRLLDKVEQRLKEWAG